MPPNLQDESQVNSSNYIFTRDFNFRCEYMKESGRIDLLSQVFYVLNGSISSLILTVIDHLEMTPLFNCIAQYKVVENEKCVRSVYITLILLIFFFDF